MRHINEPTNKAIRKLLDDSGCCCQPCRVTSEVSQSTMLSLSSFGHVSGTGSGFLDVHVSFKVMSTIQAVNMSPIRVSHTLVENGCVNTSRTLLAGGWRK